MYSSRVPWAYSWDESLPGAQLLLYQLTGKDVYKNDVQNFCDYAMGIQKTSGGQTHLSQWGSNRYAANFAFICLGAANSGIKTDEYTDYADKQIGYMLGDSGRSFVVGFGENYPKQPHHKAASCDNPPAQCTWDTFNNVAQDNPHELLGALVGGPKDLGDTYIDLRTDYITNEVTLDYNAGFQGVVAGLKAKACEST